MTYSISICSRYLVENLCIYPTSRCWIMTHAQCGAKETLENLRELCKYRFTHDESTYMNLPFYDLGDGKILYQMTGHSTWQRKFHPFLRCKCKRGQSIDPNHVCEGMSSDEYIHLHKASKERWEKRKETVNQRGVEYNMKAHMSWVDEKNFGVSHLSAFPREYNINNIVFDIFHGRGNVVKVFLRYMRRMFNGNFSGLSHVAKILFTLPRWSLAQLEPWLLENKVASLKGKHTKSFTYNIKKITHTLNSLLPQHIVKDFCTSMEIYQELSEMSSIVIIDRYNNVSKFLRDITSSSSQQEIGKSFIATYDKKVESFYSHARNNLLTENIPGDKETFYLHCVRWEFPRMLKWMYSKHQLGLGVLSMEGFESKNLESKTTVKRNINNIGNIFVQSLTHLSKNFWNDTHNVEKERKKRILDWRRNSCVAERGQKKQKTRANSNATNENIDLFQITHQVSTNNLLEESINILCI